MMMMMIKMMQMKNTSLKPAIFLFLTEIVSRWDYNVQMNLRPKAKPLLFAIKL